MEREPLFLCMTMDVERIGGCSPTGGPPSWEFGIRSVQSYCENLAERGIPVTLFVVPDTAIEQGDLLRDVAGATGTELGMHMHPQCWKDHYLDPEGHDYLGGYSREAQYQMLEEGRDQITEAIGQRPMAFRGGNFSANDETFRVLVDLGFTHGSVSQPERVATRYKAVWKDAFPDVHRAHEAFRTVPGTLDFVEVPLTSDRERIDHWTGVGDVRIEGATADQVGKAVQQEVGRQVADHAPIKHVCILTHNTVNYWSDREEERGRLGVLNDALDRIQEIGEDLGLEIRGATIAAVRAAYVARTAVR